MLAGVGWAPCVSVEAIGVCWAPSAGSRGVCSWAGGRSASAGLIEIDIFVRSSICLVSDPVPDLRTIADIVVRFDWVFALGSGYCCGGGYLLGRGRPSERC